MEELIFPLPPKNIFRRDESGMGVNSQASISISFRFSLSNTPAFSGRKSVFKSVRRTQLSGDFSVELINLTSKAVKS